MFGFSMTLPFWMYLRRIWTSSPGQRPAEHEGEDENEDEGEGEEEEEDDEGDDEGEEQEQGRSSMTTPRQPPQPTAATGHGSHD